MLDLDDYETEYMSKQEKKERGYQAVYSANLMGLSNLKPLQYIIFEHNVFCKSSILFKLVIPGLFFKFFSVFFSQTSLFCNNLMWRNVHPSYGAGIWSHDLLNVSLIP